MIGFLQPNSITNGAGAPWKTDTGATTSAAIVSAISRSTFYPNDDFSHYAAYDESLGDTPDYLEMTLSGVSDAGTSSGDVYRIQVYVLASWYGFDSLSVDAFLGGSWVGGQLTLNNGFGAIISFNGSYSQTDLTNLKIRITDDGSPWDYRQITVYQAKVLAAYKKSGNNDITVANNSFETPVVGDFQYNPSGATWDLTAAGIARNGSFGFVSPTPDGSQVMILQTDAAVGFLTFTGFTVGNKYTVTFISSHRASNSANQVSVKWDSTEVGNLTPDHDEWLTYSYGTFTATSTSHTLYFQGQTNADVTTFIDDIHVEEETVSGGGSGSNMNNMFMVF